MNFEKTIFSPLIPPENSFFKNLDRLPKEFLPLYAFDIFFFCFFSFEKFIIQVFISCS